MDEDVQHFLSNWRASFPGSGMGSFPAVIKLELSKKKGAA